MSRSLRRQRGTTLVIALIMLVLLTLFAVSSLNTSRTNLKVVGNMQQRNEALNASQQTIEAVISTPQFIANPANAVPTPCGAANTMCTDVTGDDPRPVAQNPPRSKETRSSIEEDRTAAQRDRDAVRRPRPEHQVFGITT